MKKILLVIFILFMVPVMAKAITIDFTGFIGDEANILDEETKNDLNITLWDLQKKSGADIAVVTLESLNGDSVENVALNIGRTYKLGSKEKNNGVVFLIAPNERVMRIELGIGLENKIHKSTLNYIRDYDILPYFRKEDYKNGIVRGTYALARTVAEAENVTLDEQGLCPPQLSQSSSKSSSKNENQILLYILAMLLSGLSSRMGGGRKFDSSGFGGFGGGGGFRGSGCSGKW